MRQELSPRESREGFAPLFELGLRVMDALARENCLEPNMQRSIVAGRAIEAHSAVLDRIVARQWVQEHDDYSSDTV